MTEDQVLTPLKAGFRFALLSNRRIGLLPLLRPVEVKWKALHHDVLSLT